MARTTKHIITQANQHVTGSTPLANNVKRTEEEIKTAEFITKYKKR